jgi:hypothetical protein
MNNLLDVHGSLKVSKQERDGRYSVAFENYGEAGHQFHVLGEFSTQAPLESFLRVEAGISPEAIHRLFSDLRDSRAAEILDVTFDAADFKRLTTGATRIAL